MKQTIFRRVTIGRAVVLFDHFFKDRMLRAAGLEPTAKS